MEMEEAEHVDALIDAFEEAYSKVYARSARSPSLGYLTPRRSSTARSRSRAGPAELEEVSGEPPVSSTRTVRWRDGEAQTSIIRLEEVIAGHEISGPAIVEH